MESKYKERSIELLKEELFYIDGDSHIDTSGEVIIKAMCQLAEEVENNYKHIELYKTNRKLEKALSEMISVLREKEKTLYTKQQVEELLQEQRELTIQKANINWTENDVDLGSDDVFSFRDQDGNWCKIKIDDESILNAKLEI